MAGVGAVVRDYRSEDLEQVLRLWQLTGGFDDDRLTVEQALELLAAAGTFAVVAEAEGEIVGAALAAALAGVG